MLYNFIVDHYSRPLPKNDEKIVVENLIKKGVFYFSTRGKEVKYQVIKPYKISFPLELAVIHFTNKCNLNCLHCYFKSIKTEEELKIEEIKSVIEKLVEMNVYKFLITGGEPLIRKDIFKICRTLANYKVLFSINTNGTLLNRRTSPKSNQ
jgi:MoaA/NifB/PqqE/SkfB family radical SAM enzyme